METDIFKSQNKNGKVRTRNRMKKEGLSYSPMERILKVNHWDAFTDSDKELLKTDKQKTSLWSFFAPPISNHIFLQFLSYHPLWLVDHTSL